jgi:hypothetical protein
MATANKFYFTSGDLVDSIKTRGQIPDTQNLISDDRILQLANEEMSTTLLPMVLSKHEAYYLVKEVIQFENGKNRYDIPSRSIGSKIREVSFLQDIDNLNELREMVQISVDDLSHQQFNSNVNHFYIEDDQIVIHVDPESISSTSGILVHYFQRPNALVLGIRVGVITNIDRNSGIVTFSTLPDNFEANQKYDFIRTKSPHKILDYDVMIKYITLDPLDIPDSLVVGDRVALAGETDLVNAPTELHPLLAQMTCSLVLESIGDNQNLVLAEQRLKRMKDDVGSVLDNRVIGSPIKARRRNSPLRNRAVSRRSRGL